MHEAEGVNFKVGLMSNEPTEKDIRKARRGLRGPNLDEVISLIKNLAITEDDKQFLIKRAKSTPHGALKNFCQNYKNYLKKNT